MEFRKSNVPRRDALRSARADCADRCQQSGGASDSSLARSWRLSLRRLRFLEISRIRRRLVLLGGHQEPIPAQEIRVRSDDHIVVALGARNSAPARIGIGITPIRLVDAPRPRQRMVEYGDFLMKEVCVV